MMSSSASPSDSSVATSFLDGLRRFLEEEDGPEALAMRDTKALCFIRRLSRFELRKPSSTTAPGRNVLGRAGPAAAERRARTLARALVRLLMPPVDDDAAAAAAAAEEEEEEEEEEMGFGATGALGILIHV